MSYGYTSIPDHMSGSDLGDLDQRPVFMRGGFFPQWLGVPRALGEWEPILEPFTLGEINPEKTGIRGFLEKNPYLVMGVGIGIGACIAHTFFGSKNKKRRRRRRR